MLTVNNKNAVFHSGVFIVNFEDLFFYYFYGTTKDCENKNLS